MPQMGDRERERKKREVNLGYLRCEMYTGGRIGLGTLYD